MNKINNTKSIQEYLQQIPTLQNQIENINEEIQNYLKFMKNEQFEKKENESKEDALRRSESMLDRIKEIVLRRQNVNKKSEDAVQIINEIKQQLEIIINECRNDDENLCDANNETIEEIIEIRRQIMEEKILPHQKEIEKYKYDFEMNKNELMKQMMESKQERERKIRKEKEEKERIEKERKEAEERRKREEEEKQMVYKKN